MTIFFCAAYRHNLFVGKDATEAFEDVGHSDEARDLLKTLFVGDFDGPSVSCTLCFTLHFHLIHCSPAEVGLCPRWGRR